MNTDSTSVFIVLNTDTTEVHDSWTIHYAFNNSVMCMLINVLTGCLRVRFVDLAM